jgi:hypothetical protein
MRDHEYKRHGTLTLMAGSDLLTGHVHPLVEVHPKCLQHDVLACAASFAAVTT